jgi:hypothetical protein
MIALWMLHAAVLGALLSIAGLAGERALRLLGRPTRWVWAATLALGVALPLLRLPQASRVAPPAAPAAAEVATPLDLSELPRSAESAPAGPVARLAGWMAMDAVEAPAAWRALDLPLAAGWATIGLLLALRTAVAGRRMSGRLRQWPRIARDGLTLHVAPDLGPAVFGAVRPAVIVPRWALDDDRLPLMLAHEAAHLRARDPLLLLAGLAAAVLLPWSPAAWWQLRRLRLAVELDCDARVLAGADAPPAAVRAYGALLLDVAHRSTAARPLAALAPTLLATPSTLSRRIHAMTTPRPRHAVRRALPPAVGAALLLAAACELPRPTGPRAEARVPLTQVTTPVAARAEAPTVTIDEVRSAVRAAMPGALDERRGATQRLWIVQEPDGRVRSVMRGTADAAPGADKLGMTDVTIAELTGGDWVRTSPDLGSSATQPRLPADGIDGIHVYKVGPGRVFPDSTEAIWIRLKTPGARTASAPQRRVDAAAVVMPRDGAKAPARVSLRGGTVTIQPTDSARRAGVGVTTLSVRSAGDTTGPKPLYFIDGVEFDGASSALPKPERIASIMVIKGAAAERKYGARAVGGAIEITTKQD